MKPLKILALAFLILLSNCIEVCLAGEIKAEILQNKLDRYYFNAGSESYIFKGCRFSVLNNNDTIYSGFIDEVFEGVSISEKIEDSSLVEATFVLVETADVDSVMQIEIFDSTFVEKIFSDLTQYTNYGNEIIFTHLINPKIDGTISYNKRDILSRHEIEISTDAPYIVVLIPNLSKEINRNGMLTTSLYYRFDAALIPYLFSGDNVNIKYSLYPTDSLFTRAYSYDSEKGRQIAGSIKRNHGEISISYKSATLAKAAIFFNDILSRDRFNVYVEKENSTSDFTIALIPYNKLKPELSLSVLLDFLSKTNPKYQSLRESLTINRNYLELAENAKSAAFKEYYLNLVDYSLKYDFGVFPLFQPTIFFHYNNNLTNCRFDENGQLDYKALIKLKLPASISGVIK